MAKGHSVKLSVKEIETLIYFHGQEAADAMRRLTSVQSEDPKRWGDSENRTEYIATNEAFIKEHRLRFDHLVKRRNEILSKGESDGNES